jgi:hypothetical protein
MEPSPHSPYVFTAWRMRTTYSLLLSIVTRLGSWRCGVRIPERQRCFLFYKNIYISPGAHPVSYLMGTVVLSRDKWTREVNRSPLLSPEVKNECGCMPSWRGQGQLCLPYRSIFNLILDITTTPRTQPTLYAHWHNTKRTQRFPCYCQQAKECELAFCNTWIKKNRCTTNQQSLITG